MQKKQQCDAEGDAFRRMRSVTESGDRQGIEEFNRAALDSARGHAAAVDNATSEKDFDPSVETSAEHAATLARAKRGL